MNMVKTFYKNRFKGIEIFTEWKEETEKFSYYHGQIEVKTIVGNFSVFWWYRIEDGSYGINEDFENNSHAWYYEMSDKLRLKLESKIVKHCEKL